MKLKLIRVSVDGVTGYLKGRSIFDENPVTQDPLEALNYNEEEELFRVKRMKHNLKQDVDGLNVRGVSGVTEAQSKSGLWIDKPAEIIEYDHCS